MHTHLYVRGLLVLYGKMAHQFKFEIMHASRRCGSLARVGQLTTPHGMVTTPAFVAVGTHAAVKAATPAQAAAAGQQLLFCNTYHLLLHPGPDIIASLGGLHKYMGLLCRWRHSC